MVAVFFAVNFLVATGCQFHVFIYLFTFNWILGGKEVLGNV